MPVVDVFDREKKKLGTIQLSDSVFAAPFEGKDVLMYEVVRKQMADWRSGTHATKTRSTISGGNSKPFRQKGTGRARRGTMRATILRGGAVALGPQPRDYSYHIPKRKGYAAVSALMSKRLAEGKLFVIKEFNFGAIKAKDARVMLKDRWNIDEAIIVGGDTEENFILSVRNMPEFLYIHYSQINLYDVMAYRNIILTEEAAKYFNEVLAS